MAQRLAGLRTNTLVALGAASFVIFGALFPDESSPTRVAAQVVSGIGFLGAGLIFREGLSVRGLNTAATLWCSAAIGVLAGSGFASLCGGGRRFCSVRQSAADSIVAFINRQPLVAGEVDVGYLVSVTCRSPDEAHVRALLLQGLASGRLALRRLDSNDLEGTGKVVVIALVTAPERVDADVETIVGRLIWSPRGRRRLGRPATTSMPKGIRLSGGGTGGNRRQPIRRGGLNPPSAAAARQPRAAALSCLSGPFPTEL